MRWGSPIFHQVNSLYLLAKASPLKKREEMRLRCVCWGEKDGVGKILEFGKCFQTRRFLTEKSGFCS